MAIAARNGGEVYAFYAVRESGAGRLEWTDTGEPNAQVCYDGQCCAYCSSSTPPTAAQYSAGDWGDAAFCWSPETAVDAIVTLVEDVTPPAADESVASWYGAAAGLTGEFSPFQAAEDYDRGSYDLDAYESETHWTEVVLDAAHAIGVTLEFVGTPRGSWAVCVEATDSADTPTSGGGPIDPAAAPFAGQPVGPFGTSPASAIGTLTPTAGPQVFTSGELGPGTYRVGVVPAGTAQSGTGGVAENVSGRTVHTGGSGCPGGGTAWYLDYAPPSVIPLTSTRLYYDAFPAISYAIAAAAPISTPASVRGITVVVCGRAPC